MLEKFLKEECKGYTVDIRYSGVNQNYIVKVHKEDVCVKDHIDPAVLYNLSSTKEEYEFYFIDFIRKLLREADRKLEEHTANKGKITKVEKKGEEN